MDGGRKIKQTQTTGDGRRRLRYIYRLSQSKTWRYKLAEKFYLI